MLRAIQIAGKEWPWGAKVGQIASASATLARAAGLTPVPTQGVLPILHNLRNSGKIQSRPERHSSALKRGDRFCTAVYRVNSQNDLPQ